LLRNREIVDPRFNFLSFVGTPAAGAFDAHLQLPKDDRREAD
jgi:hypothetical protein